MLQEKGVSQPWRRKGTRMQSQGQPHLEALPRSSALPYFVTLQPFLSQQFIHLQLSLSNRPAAFKHENSS